MHEEVKQFIRRLKLTFPDKFKGKRVVEFGSLDINGTPRELFENCNYTGVDWRKGKGVDIVSLAHEFKDEEKFDVIISTEMLEHDKYAKQSIWNMMNLLRPGGLLIITCAGPRRHKHELECGVGRHYQNLTKKDLFHWILLDDMKECMIKDTGLDLQFYALKEGKDEKRNNN